MGKNLPLGAVVDKSSAVLEGGIAPKAVLFRSLMRYGYRNAIGAPPGGHDSVQVDFEPFVDERAKLLHDLMCLESFGTPDSFFDKWLMDFKEESIASQSSFYRLVDDPHGCSNGYHRIEAFHILWVEADTTVTDPHSYSKGSALIGPMNEIAGNAESESEPSKGILGVSAWDHTRELLSRFRVLLPDALGWIPRRIYLFGYYLGSTLGGSPIIVTDAHREGVNDLFVGRKIVES